MTNPEQIVPLWSAAAAVRAAAKPGRDEPGIPARNWVLVGDLFHPVVLDVDHFAKREFPGLPLYVTVALPADLPAERIDPGHELPLDQIDQPLALAGELLSTVSDDAGLVASRNPLSVAAGGAGGLADLTRGVFRARQLLQSHPVVRVQGRSRVNRPRTVVWSPSECVPPPLPGVAGRVRINSDAPRAAPCPSVREALPQPLQGDLNGLCVTASAERMAEV